MFGLFNGRCYQLKLATQLLGWKLQPNKVWNLFQDKALWSSFPRFLCWTITRGFSFVWIFFFSANLYLSSCFKLKVKKKRTGILCNCANFNASTWLDLMISLIVFVPGSNTQMPDNYIASAAWFCGDACWRKRKNVAMPITISFGMGSDIWMVNWGWETSRGASALNALGYSYLLVQVKISWLFK